MCDLLRVSLVQVDLKWGDVDANLSLFTKLLGPLKGKSDLIVLPEMFTSGFSMEQKEQVAQYAHKTMQWMQIRARETDAYVMGSIVVEQDNQFFNRICVVGPQGEYYQYDKRHLFRMGDEHLHFGHGKRRLIFSLKGWRICPLVCYDLRFPVWSRNCNDYDLLIYVANWPRSRRDVWITLLKARALENQSYVLGVNRVGLDGMKLSYCGDSMALDARAKVVGACSENKQQIVTLSLSLDELKRFREKFPVAQDADNFQLLE